MNSYRARTRVWQYPLSSDYTCIRHSHNNSVQTSTAPVLLTPFPRLPLSLGCLSNYHTSLDNTLPSFSLGVERKLYIYIRKLVWRAAENGSARLPSNLNYSDQSSSLSLLPVVEYIHICIYNSVWGHCRPRVNAPLLLLHRFYSLDYISLTLIRWEKNLLRAGELLKRVMRQLDPRRRLTLRCGF